MSLLLKSLKCNKIPHFYKVLSTVPGRQGHWYPNYKPGPYPTTPEERKAAAEKYNLLPEEYEPYPRGDDGAGDYPKLPFESVDSRDPYYPWDNQQLRKNFNEPVHRDIMALLPEALSTGPISYYTPLQQFLIFIFMTLGAVTVIYLSTKFQIVEPISEKQYPAPGVTHYTFDVDEEEAERRQKSGRVVCYEEPILKPKI